MSPTSLTPGAGAVKSRATRSGTAVASPGVVVVGRNGLGWQGIQAQAAHHRPDQLRAAGHLSEYQLGVDTSVTVGAVGVLEDRSDDGFQLLTPRCRGRGRPAQPVVEPGSGHPRPHAHQRGREERLLRVDELVLRDHRYSWAKKAAAFPMLSKYLDNMGYPDVLVMPMSA